MNFELWQLFLAGFGYMLVLFCIASATERGLIPAKIVRHPAVYVLSLGVFGSAWAIYGIVGLAHQYGYSFLSYYVGLAGTFLFAPLLLMPLLRICNDNLLSSLADVLSFRYRSQWAGAITTIFLLLAVMPLLALQIQAVSDSLHILSSSHHAAFDSDPRDDNLALIFCLMISAFTVSFGSRHLTAHERHNGLVVAIAFESVVKLVAFSTIGLVAVFYVFGGPTGLELWLQDNDEALSLLSSPIQQDSTRSLLLIFFSAAVVMPHVFHMTFAENTNLKVMQTASWGFPLFLLLMSLPVLPILWSGFELDSHLPSEYYTLGVGIELNSPTLALLAFIGGLSAASGAIIVITLALASMCLKHLILPIYRPGTDRDIYRWLLWIRRLLIVCIILAGYLFFRVIVGRESLSNLGIAAFIGSLQFLPGVIATLYWQQANRIGLIAGLAVGFTLWLLMLLGPIITSFSPVMIGQFYFNYSQDEFWSTATIMSLGCNTAVFIIVSLLTKTTEEEVTAAEICSTDDISRPTRRALSIRTPQEMKQQLSNALGRRSAEREVNRALTELQMTETESRPFALRRLRYRLEANLSSLMGPSVAHEMVEQLLPYTENSEDQSGEDINLIEGQLENYKTHLTGLAADLDNLRRYHRQTLQDLPIGVCSLGRDNEVLMWNQSLSQLTDIRTFDVIGSLLSNLPEPWAELLDGFSNSAEPHLYKQRIDIDGSPRWINLHKTNPAMSDGLNDGKVLVIEDASDLQRLEDELTHSERLASIGRLAAGVAHEIGNPITGIACLAQNLRYDTDNPESLETAQEILHQTDRVSKIVQTLVNFAHAGTESSRHDPEPVDVFGCAAEAIHLLELNKEARPIRFSNQCTEQLFILGDTQRLLQVLVNLLSNARDASPADSLVTITTKHHNTEVLISVTDEGSGISKEHLEQIFDPFFTTKEAGDGTGLGLSLVYSIVEDLGGYISVDSPVDAIKGGTRFTVRLPYSAPD